MDWQRLRTELAASGDHEGLAQLDAWLPQLKDEPFSVREEVIEGRVVKVSTTWLCSSRVLDWFRDRRNAQQMLAALSPALTMDATTASGMCARWQALASWVPRFSRQGLLGFGDAAKEGHTIGGIPSPYRSWATAFREATATVLPLMRDTEDVTVHRLLQDLDDVLQGKAVPIAEHLRDVDALVRAALDRAKKQSAGTEPENQAQARRIAQELLTLQKTRRPVEHRATLDVRGIEAILAMEKDGISWDLEAVAKVLGLKSTKSLTNKDSRTGKYRCPMVVARWKARASGAPARPEHAENTDGVLPDQESEN